MPEMIRILCEGLATVLFTLICTRFLCKNMKKRDFRFVPWLPYVLTGCGSARLFLLGGLSPRTFCGIAFLFVLLYASVQDHSTHEADDILSVMMLMLPSRIILPCAERNAWESAVRTSSCLRLPRSCSDSIRA